MSFRKCLRDDIAHGPPGNLKKIKKKQLERRKPHHAHTTARICCFFKKECTCCYLMKQHFHLIKHGIILILLYITIF